MKTSLYIFNIGLALVYYFKPLPVHAQLSMTGQIRTRTELLHGQGSPLSKGDDPAFFTSQRTRLSLDYKGYRTRFFVAAQDVRVWGQDASSNNRLTNANINGFMLHEAWGEISMLDTNKTKLGKAFSVKLGRQELIYDDARLLGNLDWLQQGRRHDALLLKYNNDTFTAHVGIAYNQNREIKTGTLYDGIPIGYPAGTNGIGTMYKSMQFAYLEKKITTGNVSFLIFKDDFQKFSVNETGLKTFTKGTWNRVTLGPYLSTRLGKKWDITTSAYWQTGHDKTGDRLNAYMYSIKGTYALNGIISGGPGFDLTSGTPPGATQNRSFDPLYGTPHKFWGQMDYFYVANGFGQGGLSDIYLHSTIKASKKVSVQIDLHQFSSASQLKNALDENISGNLGNEIDLIATYNLTKSISFQGGYSVYFTTTGLAQIKEIKDPQKIAQWAYVMINIKPEFLK